MFLLETNRLLKIEKPQLISEALYLLATDKGQAGLFSMPTSLKAGQGFPRPTFHSPAQMSTVRRPALQEQGQDHRWSLISELIYSNTS